MNIGYKIVSKTLLVLPLCTAFLFTSMPSQNFVGAFAPSSAMASGDGGGSESGGGDGGGEFEGPRSRRKNAGKKPPKREILLRKTTLRTRHRGVRQAVDSEIKTLAGRVLNLIELRTVMRRQIRGARSEGRKIFGVEAFDKRILETEKKIRDDILSAIVQLEIYMRLKGIESPAMAVLQRNTRTAKRAIR